MKKLIEYNTLGIIPGPEESEAEFYKRAEGYLCLNLDQDLPFNMASKVVKEVAPKALNQVCGLFDICPDWTPVYFSNWKMAPWHGGSMWAVVDDLDKEGVLIQLNKAFQKKDKLFGIYSKDEIIAHELIHIGRAAFNEPKFEEILACQTSKNAFRRWFGPIVAKNWEALLFVAVVAISFFSHLFWASLMFYLAPLSLFFAAVFRLLYRQAQFSACKRKLKVILKQDYLVNCVIYRLTDDEIISFGRMEPQKIKDFIQNLAIKQLRGAIVWSYFQ